MGIHKRGAVHSTTKWCWFLESEVQHTNDINLVASKGVRTPRLLSATRLLNSSSHLCNVDSTSKDPGSPRVTAKGDLRGNC